MFYLFSLHDALPIFDLHVYFAAQMTFGGLLRYLATQSFDLLVGKILCFRSGIDPGSGADLLRGGATDTIDVGQRDNSVLVIRNVDACNTGHSVELQLTATYAPEAKKRARDISAVGIKNQPDSALAAGLSLQLTISLGAVCGAALRCRR